MQKEIDLLIKNGQVITCQGSSRRPKLKKEMQDIAIIENGTVAIRGDEIAWVGNDGDAKNEVEINTDTKVIDAYGKTILPGLVDPHTHIVFGGSREHELELKLQGVPYLDILAQGGGILSTVHSTREASKDELIEKGLKHANQMLAQGTTTAEAKSGYGLTTDHEIKQLEAIKEINDRHEIDLIPTFLGAHAIP